MPWGPVVKAVGEQRGDSASRPYRDVCRSSAATRFGRSGSRTARVETFSYDDVTHYGKIVAALKETMHVMQEIDETIPCCPME